MPNKDDLTNERRAQILQAAATVFARSGVDGARMDDIVTESGLSKGSLYWYFDSKQEIVIALVDEVLRAEFEQLKRLVESPGTVLQRLNTFVDTHAAVFSEHPTLGKLGLEFYAMSGRVPQIKEFIRRYYQDYIDKLVELLQQGRDRGELTLGDPNELAVNLVCLLEGLTLLWALEAGEVNLPRQFRGGLAALVGSQSTYDVE
ncbi:MAG: TetR/AcrR family transcriptional regulator [Nitrolancea sp.]